MLDAILAMQHQARAALERAPEWSRHEAAVAALAAVDVQAHAAAIAPALVDSYRAWREASSEPIQAAMFEWSHRDPYAYGYGFATCRVGPAERILGVQMPAIELEDGVFGECGGFDVSALLAHVIPDRSTQYLDLVILKVAELVHHAVTATATTPAFAALARREPFHVIVEQHDRFPVLAY